jgi:hypothetical protein
MAILTAHAERILPCGKPLTEEAMICEPATKQQLDRCRCYLDQACVRRPLFNELRGISNVTRDSFPIR